MNEELKIIIKAVTEQAEKNLEEIKKELEKIEKQGKKTGEENDKSMSKMGKAAAVAVAAVVALTTAMVKLGESALEFQKEQAKLNTAFLSMGASAEQATKTYTELYRFLGDNQAATEAAQSLALITTNEKELAEWTNILQGAYALMGDKLPTEGLAEAANETIRVGKVTGNLADALNWAGVNEDAFNAALANTNSQAEREALVRSTLNTLYSNAAAMYERNNASLLANNEAQARLNAAMADAARYTTPLLTAFSNLAAISLQAVKPALETISAVLIVLVRWITTAIQAIGSFFGAFSDNGKEAVGAVKSVGSSFKGSGGLGLQEDLSGANKEAQKLKQQMMGFDELNVVSSQTSSSGAAAGIGGAGGVSIPPLEIPEMDMSALGLDDFQDKIADVEKAMKGIAALAGLAGAGFAAWKITNFVKDIKAGNKNMKDFGKHAKTASGVLLIIAGAILLIKGYADAWVNGIDWGNFAMILGGIGAIVGGLALAVSPLAAAIALIAGGIAMVVIGIKDFITNGYSMEAVITIAVGAIGVLIGVIWAFNAALLANPITWVVVAIMALVAAFVILWNDCDAFRQFWINLWDGIVEVFTVTWEAIKQFFTVTIPNIFNSFINFIKDNWQGLLLLLVNPFAGAFKLLYDNCDGFREFIDEWVDKIAQFFKDLWKNIKNVFTGVGKWFSDIFTGAWNGIKNAFSAVGSFFTNIWNTIKEIFSKVGTTIGDAVSGAFKSAVNWVLEKAVGLINGFIDSINWAIDILNEIPGVDISTISRLDVPEFAKGGVVNSATLGVFGEAGKEAVIPLENNTEWMDILADRIATRNAPPTKLVLMLDKQELGWANINSINNITKQTGRLQLTV
jgi:phage-related protein